MDNPIIVEAEYINKYQFSYECPFCFKLRNGRIVDNRSKYKSAKPTLHLHGSGGELHNRIEHRVNHCSYNKQNVIIHITDNTKRN